MRSKMMSKSLYAPVHADEVREGVPGHPAPRADAGSRVGVGLGALRLEHDVMHTIVLEDA